MTTKGLRGRLDDLPSYRGGEGAGFRPHSPASMDGARLVNPKRLTLCERYYQLILQSGQRGMSAEDIAAIVEREPYLIRPRLTDLKNVGRVVAKADERRAGHYGVDNTVWIAACFGPKTSSEQGDLFVEGGSHVTG
jgi:hypothetical protein